jgi:cyclophilin family peptidyl-prolyl cis-trans isomerase/HEAT repeat protein
MRRLIGRACVVAMGAAALLVHAPAPAFAQRATRLAILQAEDRRAPTARDLAVIRAGARSGDPLTAQIALRALGRLERPSLIADILPGLRHRLPEVRAEAANAVAQAAQGTAGPPSGAARTASPIGSAQTALINRLAVEADPGVRAALCEAIARLPYDAAGGVARAETTLVAFAARAEDSGDRLGVAKGFEALTRLHRSRWTPSPATVSALLALARNTDRNDRELLREARVRRLALESLITIEAVDAPTVESAASDPDPQVRRLALRAAAYAGPRTVIAAGLADVSPLVRIEALRTTRTREGHHSCAASLAAIADADMRVVAVAIDQLARCGGSAEAVEYLTQAVADVEDAEAPRNWHRSAHAIVALATAAPDRASSAVLPFTTSSVWQLRSYAARAAAALGRRDLLEGLARDTNANVVEAAITGLATVAGHAGDAIYLAALTHDSPAVARAAALALDGTRDAHAVEALQTALARADEDDRPGAMAVRSAITDTLTGLGVTVRPRKTPIAAPAAPLDDAALRRLAAPRARFTIRDVGVFDVALFTMEAPATVLRFAQLAASGYYDGLTFHRVVPNGVIQGGSPGANEYSSDAPLMRDEVGLWPHVRGALGISTRGRDTGDAQIFIDLVDNPRYDHTYTVFAQILNGIDVVDRILEGDTIERVEILP